MTVAAGFLEKFDALFSRLESGRLASQLEVFRSEMRRPSNPLEVPPRKVVTAPTMPKPSTSETAFATGFAIGYARQQEAARQAALEAGRLAYTQINTAVERAYAYAYEVSIKTLDKTKAGANLRRVKRCRKPR